MTFNAAEHLMKIGQGEKAKDYLPVAYRFVWYREQCPTGTIDTEIISLEPDKEVEAEAYVWNPEKRRSEKIIKHAKGACIVKAVVTNGLGGRASAVKSENAASFPDYFREMRNWRGRSRFSHVGLWRAVHRR